ncbi:hypothetical protein R3P38DRAFT_3075534 [Favolaschia claudopus]|uniref:Uncharacterized protein n=1 Tax=Favolaschia claudopus TaxID=2862362 RepID=A0AAV9ZY79_9AGAR
MLERNERTSRRVASTTHPPSRLAFSAFNTRLTTHSETTSIANPHQPQTLLGRRRIRIRRHRALAPICRSRARTQEEEEVRCTLPLRLSSSQLRFLIPLSSPSSPDPPNAAPPSPTTAPAPRTIQTAPNFPRSTPNGGHLEELNWRRRGISEMMSRSSPSNKTDAFRRGTDNGTSFVPRVVKGVCWKASAARLSCLWSLREDSLHASPTNLNVQLLLSLPDLRSSNDFDLLAALSLAQRTFRNPGPSRSRA